MCEDSRENENIAKLMNGAKADMVYTDPPYGMNLKTDYSQIKGSKKSKLNRKYKGKVHRQVIGDHADFTCELIDVVFENFGYCKEIFLWGADYYAELLDNKNEGAWVVWDKRLDENSDKIVGSCFELCWSKAKHKRLICRMRWTGVFGLEEARNRVHPTQKPSNLAQWFFSRWGREGDIVVDLYGGSGSTLLACEKDKRTCYMAEIDPRYCDVIIARWEKLTGRTAELAQ
ncbi:MAG: site-specific DNA-methyltransferase [Cytophagaceae bacterium]|nr:MAG: site-specific DNA-methyltransferase [Cytophagaceae bacterium]